MAIGRLDSSTISKAPPVVPAKAAAVKPRSLLGSASHLLGDVFEDAGKAINTASKKVASMVNPPAPKTVGAMPSFSDTIQPSAPLTDAQKTARGALKIDSKADPVTYDGMYLGADGYAYPPSKFQASEVPSFKPAAQHALAPPRTAYYVNGIGSSVSAAIGEAKETANKSGSDVVPIYNATQGTFDDVVQTAEDRADFGNDKASATLRNAVVDDLKAGKQVNVIGYSQGGAIASDALEQVAQQVDAKTLANANVITIAGAGKNFPAGPKYTFYVNNEDAVPNWLGVHRSNPIPDVLNTLVGLTPLGILNGGGVGSVPKGVSIRTFDDPAGGGGPVNISAHELSTYYGHIADAA